MKRPLKLCLIAPLPPPYGGVAQWEQIVEREIRKHKDMEVSIINIAANKREMDGRNIFDRIFYGGYTMMKAYISLRKLVKKNCPDVVHMTTSGGLGFYRDILLLRYLDRKHVPSSYHIHFGRTVEYRKENRWCWRQIKKAVSMATETIVLDGETQHLLKDHARHIIRINNPIGVDDLKQYRRVHEEDSIVFIGWVIKTKGVEELIDAFIEFNRDSPMKHRLFIIGPGDEVYVSCLKDKCDDSVFFTGELEHGEAMRVLSASKALVLPSYTEGFPNVVLEAMALEKLVIATRVGAVPDILSQDAGILIDPYDASQIKEALHVAMNDQDRKRMALNGFNKVMTMYDIKPTIEKYLAVWNKLSMGE